MMVVKKYIVSTSVIIPFRSASELFYCRVYGVLKTTALSLAFTEGQARALGMASMGRSHCTCITLSCSLGEWAGRHRCAAGPLLQGHILGPHHVPNSNVPPLHWCNWWAESIHTFDESADSWGPCVGPLGQGLQGCRDFSPILPTASHFPTPQSHCSTAKGAFFFSILEWLLCYNQNRVVFPKTVAGSICMQLQSFGDPLKMDAGRVFLLRSPQEQHKVCTVIMSFCLFWPCTRWSYVSYA